MDKHQSGPLRWRARAARRRRRRTERSRVWSLTAGSCRLAAGRGCTSRYGLSASSLAGRAPSAALTHNSPSTYRRSSTRGTRTAAAVCAGTSAACRRNREESRPKARRSWVLQRDRAPPGRRPWQVFLALVPRAEDRRGDTLMGIAKQQRHASTPASEIPFGTVAEAFQSAVERYGERVALRTRDDEVSRTWRDYGEPASGSARSPRASPRSESAAGRRSRSCLPTVPSSTSPTRPPAPRRHAVTDPHAGARERAAIPLPSGLGASGTETCTHGGG